ncbi:ribosomal-like protein [Cichlidogyrus casuarinus]|uniref:Ribosomal-like protein n=1 Tax=Cichlidogyrus casuarinus TaxID=1844966 RepID=A0ABD2QJV0_9PLAT
MRKRGSVQNPPLERLPTTNVTLLKRRRAQRLDIVKKQLERAKQIRRRAREVKSSFHTLAYFVAKSRKAHLDRNRLKVNSRKNSVQIGPENDRLGLVVRVTGNNVLSPEAKETFNLLRLSHVFSGVFIKVNKPMLKVLNIISPYCIWGYPSLRTVSDLIFKRGYTECSDGKTHSINNQIIEDKLGEHGILCIEDILHELTTVGPNFVDVLSFLLPFRLVPIDKSKEKNDNMMKYGRKVSREDWSIAGRVEDINEIVARIL